MGLYTIGDLHLSFSVNKPMDIFGGWDKYVEKLHDNWIQNITDDDTVVIAGDFSWGSSLEDSESDFQFVDKLPGRKIILKGNHDYWWSTKQKMDNFFKAKGFSTLNILHNNHYKYEQHGICGTRGWINDTSEPYDARILAREANRLETSISSVVKAGLTPVVFLHYPPMYKDDYNYDILEVLYKYSIKQCFYGHIHGNGFRYAINGERDGVEFALVSSDYLQFLPMNIKLLV